MNKKYVFLVLGILAFAGLGSAMLVTFISNSVTASVSVQSPLEMFVSLDNSTDNWTDNIIFGSIIAGENVTIYTKIENLASVDINGTFTIIVSNDNSNAMCEDFTSILLNGNEINMSVDCVDDLVNGTAQFSGNENIAPYEIDYDEIVITFHQAVSPANYIITTQIMTV